MKIQISGSAHTIEVYGDLTAEFDKCPCYILFTNLLQIKCDYTSEGIWKIEILQNLLHVKCTFLRTIWQCKALGEYSEILEISSNDTFKILAVSSTPIGNSSNSMKFATFMQTLEEFDKTHKTDIVEMLRDNGLEEEFQEAILQFLH